MSRSAAKAKPQQLPLEHRLDAELWMASRIHDLAGGNPEMFGGVKTEGERMEALRQAILTNALSQVIVGKRHGKTENFAQVFERIFGERL